MQEENSIPNRSSSSSLSSEEYLLFLGTGGGVASFERQNSSIFWSITSDLFFLLLPITNSGILFDCGCNAPRRLRELLGQERSDRVLSRLLAIVISHAHFDHIAYLLNTLQAVVRRPRSLPLLLFLPQPLIAYYSALLPSLPILFIPITDSLLHQSLPLRSFLPPLPPAAHQHDPQAEQLLTNLAVRFVRNNHNNQSFAVVEVACGGEG